MTLWKRCVRNARRGGAGVVQLFEASVADVAEQVLAQLHPAVNAAVDLLCAQPHRSGARPAHHQAVPRHLQEGQHHLDGAWASTRGSPALSDPGRCRSGRKSRWTGSRWPSSTWLTALARRRACSWAPTSAYVGGWLGCPRGADASPQCSPIVTVGPADTPLQSQLGDTVFGPRYEGIFERTFIMRYVSPLCTAQRACQPPADGLTLCCRSWTARVSVHRALSSMYQTHGTAVVVGRTTDMVNLVRTAPRLHSVQRASHAHGSRPFFRPLGSSRWCDRWRCSSRRRTARGAGSLSPAARASCRTWSSRA